MKQSVVEPKEMRVQAGYLPGVEQDALEWHDLRFIAGDKQVVIAVPQLTPEQLAQLAQRLITNRERYLAQLTVEEIVERIDQAVELWLDRQYPLRQQAEQLLPIVTGYAPETIRLGLTSYLKTFRKPQLLRFLEEDFGNYTILDGFRPRPKGGFSKAFGAQLVAHVWAGNVPALPIWSLISALLVKSASIGKVSSAEPLFAGWFAQTIAEIDSQLGQCLAIVWWKGGDVNREEAVFAHSELVVGYGNNESLKALHSRMPITTRFLAYGHKVSFGLIGREALDGHKAWQTAHAAALDVVRFDQQGCYSPQLFYVEAGGSVSPRQFAHYLAHELSALEHKYPRRPLPLAEAARFAQAKQEAELGSMRGQREGEEMIVLSEDKQTWTVVFENSGRFLPSPLDRFVRVIAVPQLEEVTEWIAPCRSLLQTVGVATAPKRLFSLAERLGSVGVTRFSALGQMTRPEAGWHHDGRFNLLDLVRFADIEWTAEQAAEQYAPYRD